MKKIILFGSSYINTFIAMKSKNFQIVKFRGAMIKGLLNKNENYQQMVKILNKNHFDYGIFMFGDPDCNFYYFKKKYVDNENGKNIDIKFFEYADQYVKLISELKNIKNKYILGVAPPSIIDDDIFKYCLKGYGILDEQQLEKVNDNDIIYKNRIIRFETFNNILENSCKKYNVNFCSIYNLLLNNKGHLNKLFRIQYNPYNIHYKFEAALIVYINSCLKFLCDTQITGISYDILVKQIHKSYTDYIADLKKKLSISEHSTAYNFSITNIENFIKKSQTKMTILLKKVKQK